MRTQFTGERLHIKTPSYQCRYSHYKAKMASWLSYLYIETMSGKTVFTLKQGPGLNLPVWPTPSWTLLHMYGSARHHIKQPRYHLSAIYKLVSFSNSNNKNVRHVCNYLHVSGSMLHLSIQALYSSVCNLIYNGHISSWILCCVICNGYMLHLFYHHTCSKLIILRLITKTQRWLTSIVCFMTNGNQGPCSLLSNRFLLAAVLSWKTCWKHDDVNMKIYRLAVLFCCRDWSTLIAVRLLFMED